MEDFKSQNGLTFVVGMIYFYSFNIFVFMILFNFLLVGFPLTVHCSVTMNKQIQVHYGHRHQKGSWRCGHLSNYLTRILTCVLDPDCWRSFAMPSARSRPTLRSPCRWSPSLVPCYRTRGAPCCSAWHTQTTSPRGKAPVLATTSTTQRTSARHVLHHVLFLCAPHHSPHSVPILSE